MNIMQGTQVRGCTLTQRLVWTRELTCCNFLDCEPVSRFTRRIHEIFLGTVSHQKILIVTAKQRNLNSYPSLPSVEFTSIVVPQVNPVVL